MSGGSFNYAHFRVKAFVGSLSERMREDRDSSPELLDRLKLIALLSGYTGELMRETDLLYSGDTGENTFMSDTSRLISDIESIMTDYARGHVSVLDI